MSERKRIYLCLAHMSDEGLEQKYIKEAFDTNWVVPLGPNVNGFEKDLEAFVGQNKRVVALSAGTAAVHLGLLAAGVKAGDEVAKGDLLLVVEAMKMENNIHSPANAKVERVNVAAGDMVDSNATLIHLSAIL